MNFVYKFHQRCTLVKTVDHLRKCAKSPSPLLHSSVHLFHSSSPRLIHPAIVIILRPVSKLIAMAVGRGFRKWWQSLPKNKKILVWNHLKRNRLLYTGSSCVMAGLGYHCVDSYVVPAPYTHRKRLMFFDSPQLNILAKFAYQQDYNEFKDYLYPEIHPSVYRVKRICRRLLQANKTMPQLSAKYWTVSVVNSPAENCIVYPTGQIVIFAGMLNLIDNDNQLAIVLAHEISHVVLEHNAEKLSYASLVDILLLVPLAVIWGFLPNDGVALVTHWFFSKVVDIFVQLPFSRTLEAEADELGLFIAAAACFDIREASSFWGRMELLEAKRSNEGSDKQLQFLSTHPSHEERQGKLDQLMASALKTREANRCPRLSTIDPRLVVKTMQEQINPSR